MGRAHGMGRGASGPPRGEPAHARVRRIYAQRLSRLELGDRYKVGDVSARLLRCWGVAADEPTGKTDPRLAALLPEHAEAIGDIGIGGVLIGDGVSPVPALAEELERALADCPGEAIDEDALWNQALAAYRSRARQGRDRELDWLTERMRVDTGGRLWSEHQVRDLLLELWLSGARWHDLGECMDRVRARNGL